MRRVSGCGCRTRSGHFEGLAQVFETDREWGDRDCERSPRAVTASERYAERRQACQLKVADCRCQPLERWVLFEDGAVAGYVAKYRAVECRGWPFEDDGVGCGA